MSNNITKSDLCSRIAKKLENRFANEIKPIVDALFEEILEVLSEDRRIEIRGFGTFKIKHRKAKIGRNPRTGEAVAIPAHKVPVFKFFKEARKI
jgi:Bacterial nucleoid DNA-binding protein